MSSIKEIVRIQNADISNIWYIKEANMIYLKGSMISALAEANEITDIEELCNHIMIEGGIDTDIYHYKIINDNQILGLSESVVYNPEIVNDPIVTMMEMFSILNETSIGAESLNVLIVKAIGLFKKGNYKQAPTIKVRHDMCQREITNIKESLAKYEKMSEEEKKSIQLTQKVSVIISSLAKLVPIGISTVKFVEKMDYDETHSKVLNGITIGSSVLNLAISIAGNWNYEKALKSYLNSLEVCEVYLSKELKAAEERDEKNKQKKAKKSSIKESMLGPSIATIMNEGHYSAE